MADGGEGTLAALVHELGLRVVEVPTCSPWNVPCVGRYGLGAEVAVVEVAAVDGIGAVAAIEEAGGLRGARITVLTDVRTTFADAARIFGPQKGANPRQVEELTARLPRIATELPRDPRAVPGTGAAGGLAGALWAAYSAEITSGADHILDAQVRQCDASSAARGGSTGRPARQKAASAVLARSGSVPMFAVVGSVGWDTVTSPFRAVLEATDAEAMRAAGVTSAGTGGTGGKRSGPGWLWHSPSRSAAATSLIPVATARTSPAATRSPSTSGQDPA
jgi:glycerate 2-kinase